MHSISYISRSQIQQCLKPSEVRISRYLDYFPQGALVKNPPAMQETQEMWVQSWSRGGMATHSRNFAENLRDRGAWRANSPWDLKRVGYDWSNWVHDMCFRCPVQKSVLSFVTWCACFAEKLEVFSPELLWVNETVLHFLGEVWRRTWHQEI